MTRSKRNERNPLRSKPPTCQPAAVCQTIRIEVAFGVVALRGSIMICTRCCACARLKAASAALS
jgi:hypothetical protein